MSKISRSSKNQEAASVERYADAFRSKHVSRSGAGELKGDGEISVKLRLQYMVECKEVHGNKMSIKLAWWKTLVENAVRENKDPVLEIRIGKHVFCGLTDNKLVELLELSNWEKPIQMASVSALAKPWAESLTIYDYELDGLNRKAILKDKLPVLNISFAESKTNLKFIPASFFGKLLVSVYG